MKNALKLPILGGYRCLYYTTPKGKRKGPYSNFFHAIFQEVYDSYERNLKKAKEEGAEAKVKSIEKSATQKAGHIYVNVFGQNVPKGLNILTAGNFKHVERCKTSIEVVQLIVDAEKASGVEFTKTNEIMVIEEEQEKETVEPDPRYFAYLVKTDGDVLAMEGKSINMQVSNGGKVTSQVLTKPKKGKEVVIVQGNTKDTTVNPVNEIIPLEEGVSYTGTLTVFSKTMLFPPEIFVDGKGTVASIKESRDKKISRKRQDEDEFNEAVELDLKKLKSDKQRQKQK